MRLAIVLVLAALLLLARQLHLRWRGREKAFTPGALPPLPVDLHQRAARTWVVFTTPYCASCRPVAARLREADPEARVVTVDAAGDPGLAGAFAVRSTPTVLLADAAGQVQARLVGAEAVEAYQRRHPVVEPHAAAGPRA